jgi:hypothetical protein
MGIHLIMTYHVIYMAMKDKEIVLLDAADKFGDSEFLSFSLSSVKNKISTFVFNPNKRTSFLIHSVCPI